MMLDLRDVRKGAPLWDFVHDEWAECLEWDTTQHRVSHIAGPAAEQQVVRLYCREIGSCRSSSAITSPKRLQYFVVDAAQVLENHVGQQPFIMAIRRKDLRQKHFFRVFKVVGRPPADSKEMP